VARDADIEIPTSRPLDSIGNRAALTMDILIRLIAFHCLSLYTFHCYLTYDPDYFRGADRFPGWDGLCLDPPGVRMDFGCVAVDPESRFRVCLCAICVPRAIRFPCLIQSFRVLLVTHTQSTPRGPAD
jgi:hypothetical protein